MAYRVVKSQAAEQDMLSILDYLVDTLSAISAARNFITLLNACYKRLCKNPRMYPICREEALADKGFRCAHVMRYIVFYTIDEESNVVKVHRIVYGAME